MEGIEIRGIYSQSNTATVTELAQVRRILLDSKPAKMLLEAAIGLRTTVGWLGRLYEEQGLDCDREFHEASERMFKKLAQTWLRNGLGTEGVFECIASDESMNRADSIVDAITKLAKTEQHRVA